MCYTCELKRALIQEARNFGDSAREAKLAKELRIHQTKTHGASKTSEVSK